MTFPLPVDEAGPALCTYLDAMAERERCADAASLRYVLAPESVVVIGASRHRGTVGRAIVDNIRTGGYAGRLYMVNPRARHIGGEPCLSSVLDLPEPADLAVIAVPAAAVLDAAERCGQRGVRSLVVITSGLDDAACADLLAACRRHGMRLVGPECFGVAVPGIGLDATFAAHHPQPGQVGLVMQGGGLGFAAADQLSRLGIGISSFASVGRKLDVSGNDMLMWWQQDGITKLAVLYLESFGNPRKFARAARRVSAIMPVLTVLAEHTADAAAAAPQVSHEALLEQAGVITARGFGELVETAALLATQPVPVGRTVAIVSNVGGAAALAAEACAGLGLTVHRPHGLTRRRLRALLPDSGTVTGPVDTTATVSGEGYRKCLDLLAADEEVNAIIALVLPTGATGDLVAAIQDADVGIPVTAVVLDQPESVRLLAGAHGGQVPAYNYPEAAAAALARAAGYGTWRAEPRGHVPDFAGLKVEDARALVRGFLRQVPDGGWLAPAQSADLLHCYGVPLPAGDDAVTPAGIEVSVRLADDGMFGNLVVLGLGGPKGDHAARLTPLTDTDAESLIHSVRLAPLLLGQAAVDVSALRDLLLRVARLSDDLPEVTAVDLAPVIAGPSGTAVAGARVKVIPRQIQDRFLRQPR